MSDKGSVYSMGGGGTNFENSVQTAFLTTMIVRGNAPCLHQNEITGVAFQTTRLGYETDDMLVTAQTALSQHRLLFQIKTDLTFSKNDTEFKKVAKDFWVDYNNVTVFDKGKDKLVIVKSGLNDTERKHIQVLLDWAKSKSSSADFFQEVNRIEIKKKRLEIFKTVFQEANNGVSILDEEMWKLFKCIEILEYDFISSSSIDKANFLNLIKLSKNPSERINEEEIWNSIFTHVSELDKNGGSILSENIPEHLLKYFNGEKYSPVIQAVVKWKNDSEIIFNGFFNTIHELHIDRPKLAENIIESIINNQFTIVTGLPGSGKSAIVKDILNKSFPNASIFIFKSDQFNVPLLANAFSGMGIDYPIFDIFSCISLIPDKIIVLDSLEKLLEAGAENAFKDFLSVLKKYPNLKVVATSRKYAVDLLNDKYGIGNINAIEVPNLNQKELSIVLGAFPILKTLMENRKITGLLSYPKYLDYAITFLKGYSGDVSNISITEFKHKLWETIVEDNKTRGNGLPAKRGNAFLKIAVQRAKMMSVFVSPENPDWEVIYALEKDGIIYGEKNKYSPAHDILEDWALVKFIESEREKFIKAKDFFQNIDTKPAIRRAFRLWVEDALVDNQQMVIKLVRETLSDSEIEKFWLDELLIAIFKSEYSAKFFSDFEDELLNNGAQLLTRCIYLIKTACKESNMDGKEGLSLLYPIGSGWKRVIQFISKHKITLQAQKYFILNFLLDWEYILLKSYQQLPEEINDVKEIVCHYILQIENKDEFWNAEPIQERRNNLISLLFNVAAVAKDEITQLVRKSSVQKEIRGDWRLRSFYETVIEYALSFTHTHALAKEFPDLLIEIANKEWKIDKEKQKEYPFHNHSFDTNYSFGIKSDIREFPSGIYKTFIYNLLCAHPIKGAEFVVDFINYSTNHYVKSELAKRSPLMQVEIELNDGKKITQWASWELWAAYRAHSVTSYLLESILMSVEKYLLALAQIKTEASRKNLKFIFNYLLVNSNSAMITSVLTSIAIGYPEEIEGEMLPILSVKQFYEWDISRSIKEKGFNMAMYDEKIPIAQKERAKSNDLPHRKKHTRGLIDFIINYQLYIRKLNKEVHSVFDKLKEKIDDDIIWEKTLNEMDIRTWEIGKYDEKLGGHPVAPKYGEKVKEFIESNIPQQEAENKSAEIATWIRKCFEKEENHATTIEKWIEYYQYYLTTKAANYIFDKPVTLAIVGLRDLKDQLSKEQKRWCIKTIINGIESILTDTVHGNISGFPKVNVMEKEHALKSFSLLFSNIENKKQQKKVIGFLLYSLIIPFADYEIDYIAINLRTELFKYHPDIGKTILKGVITYSKFRQENPINYYGAPKEQMEKIQKKEQKLIQKILDDNIGNINLSEITLDNHDGRFLSHAFLITPYYSGEATYLDFIKHFLEILFSDMIKEDDFSFQNKKGRRIHYEKANNCREYIDELLLNAPIEVSKSVIDVLLNAIKKYDALTHHRNGGLYDTIRITIEEIAYKINKITYGSDHEIQNKKFVNNFWQLWLHLFERVKSNQHKYFERILLLDLLWKEDENHWKPFEGNIHIYEKMLTEFGPGNIGSVIKVFSTIGEKSFLPDKISWLVSIIKQNPTQRHLLATVPGERLVKRIFHNHLGKIINDQKTLKDFLWILDGMIDLGSSSAYMIRENVITYKMLPA